MPASVCVCESVCVCFKDVDKRMPPLGPMRSIWNYVVDSSRSSDLRPMLHVAV